MWEKQILAIKGVFFHIEALISSEKCMVSPNFLFGYQEHFVKFCFFYICSFKLRKNIPVLGGTTYRKPEYLEIWITYAE